MPGLVLALLASCGDTPEVFEEPRTVEVAVLPAQWSPKLDLLIVVGDRPGSETLQAQLGRDLGALIAPLRAAGGAKFDLHVAVTTTDLGTSTLLDPEHPAPSIGTCSARGRDGALVTNGAPVSGAFLIDGPLQHNFTGSLDAALAQLVRAGSSGCDYEQPMSAAVRALGRDEMVGFRRLPDANLLVLLATNADDCSIHDTALLDPARTDLGPLAPFRCVAHGLTCDESLAEPGPKHHCEPVPGYLENIDLIANQLSSASPDPTHLTVAVVAGPREPLEVTPSSTLAPACQWAGTDGSIVTAEPSPRLAALADAFGPRGVAASACGPDLRPALGEVARVGKQMFDVACLDNTALRDSSTEPGIQPACHATLVRGNEQSELPECPSEGDCFALIFDEVACPRSPDYLRFAVSYATTPPRDTYARVRCEVPL